MTLVHRAYELLATLYPAYYQADGKPFVAHGVGVASILAELDQPPEMLAVGLLHNVYGNADFGDGRMASASRARRRLVRKAVGERIESLVDRFREVRVQSRPLADTLQTLPARDETDRGLILIDLVDFLEKYIDRGVLYYAHAGQEAIVPSRSEKLVLEVARALDQPRLAQMLSTALREADAARGAVPAELRPFDDRRGAVQFVPRSCRRRFPAAMRRSLRDVRRRVRLRTRLRALLASRRRIQKAG